MIDIFTKEFKDCKITVLSLDPSYTEKTQKVKAVWQIPIGIRSWFYSIAGLRLFKTLKAIKNCDLFVMGGGGFLSDIQPKVPFGWLKQMRIARYFGKPTWLYRIGAGPFLTEKGRRITRFYIENYVDKVSVRDQESRRQLTEVVGIRNNVEVRVDPVADMNVDRFIKYPDSRDNSVSLIFTEYFLNNTFSEEQKKKWPLLFKAYCAQIEAVIKKGYVAKLVFFQKNIETKLAKKFEEIFGNKVVIEFPKDFIEAIRTLNKSIAVISFRLHGNILAYALKKPFLPIIYHHKTAGFLEQTGHNKKGSALEAGDGKCWKNGAIDSKNWFEKTWQFLGSLPR